MHFHAFAQDECLFNITGNSIHRILDNDIRSSEAVIVGEFHGVIGTSEIKWELIKNLNKEYSFRDIFMEISSSAACLYNLYLATGDTTLLINPKLAYFFKTPEKVFWRKLYLYNSDLPDSLKIKIYGVDFERLEFLKVLKILVPSDYNPDNSPFTKKLFVEYDSITQNITRYGDDFEKIFSNYKTAFYQNYEHLKKVYGPAFPYIEDIFLNKSSAKRVAERDKSMYNNIIETTQKNNIKKFIGFFGLNHTNSDGDQTVAQRLITSRKYKNVINISMVCKNCIDWLQRVKHADYAGPYTYQSDTTLMESIFKNHFLNDCKFTIVPTNTINSKAVKIFSNYLILLKDQPDFN